MAVFKLMSPNYRALRGVAGSDLEKGAYTKQGATPCFTLIDVADEDSFAAVFYGEKVSAAKSTGAITAGANLYYDATTKTVNTTEGDGNFVGRAVEAAASADEEVLMEFDGRNYSLVQRIIALESA